MRWLWLDVERVVVDDEVVVFDTDCGCISVSVVSSSWQLMSPLAVIIAALSSVSVVSLSLRTIVAVGDDGIVVVVVVVAAAPVVAGASSLYAEASKTALPNTNSSLINLLLLPFLPASLR